MKALSILQPWAGLIVAGHKDIENRSWPTNFRGEFLIHAGKGFLMDDYMHLRNNWYKVRLPGAVGDFLESLNPKTGRGGIVGIAELVDCVQEHASPWKNPGTWGFVIRNARPLPFQPLRGQLGFFEVPE